MFPWLLCKPHLVVLPYQVPFLPATQAYCCYSSGPFSISFTAAFMEVHPSHVLSARTSTLWLSWCLACHWLSNRWVPQELLQRQRGTPAGCVLCIPSRISQNHSLHSSDALGLPCMFHLSHPGAPPQGLLNHCCLSPSCLALPTAPTFHLQLCPNLSPWC